MNFFTTSDGENVAQGNDGSFESGGGDLAPIPAKTDVVSTCENVKISEFEGDSYINLQWRVAKPAEYANRVYFQKLKVWDNDSKVRDKAIRMLAAIDANCGGKLAASGQEPTEMSLQQAILNRPMVHKLGVWELEDKSRSGNWVMAVSPLKKQGGGKAAPAKQPVQQAPVDNLADMDDSIPF